jgi:hypothetical protein
LPPGCRICRYMGLFCSGQRQTANQEGNGGCQLEALQDDLYSRSLLPGGAAKRRLRPSGVSGIIA